MKKIILILCLFFLFSTSLLAKENVCDWIITDGDYQEYLDDLPLSDFYSAFHVVVGNDGSCTYGWDWWETNRALEDVMQDSFNDCEEGRKKKNIDGECRPYDINRKIVWGKPELYAELTKSILGDSILELENSECREFFQINFNDYKSTNNKYFFTVESEGRCEYGMGHDAASAFKECEKFRQENNIGGKCEPFAVEDTIVWGKPELYEELGGCKNFILSKFEEAKEWAQRSELQDYYMAVVENNGFCMDGRGPSIKNAFSECERRKAEFNVDGECEIFSVRDQIVRGKPELYEELTGSKIKTYDDMQEAYPIDVGMWQLDGIINSTDPSTLQKVIYIGKEKRNFIEARTDRKDKSRLFEFKATPYVYDAYYENGKIFEILIYFENEKNKSKGKDESLAEKYAFMIGQMPNVLLQRLDAAHIYADVLGISNASANERIINIHPEGEDGYNFGNAIEELFIHELVHASLDKPIHGAYQALNKKRHKNETIKSKKLNWGDWRQAVKKDKKKYITEYAKTTMHEDLAESFTAWLALRYKNDRISDFQKQAIENRIPNRIKFFDEQQFDMHPLVLNAELTKSILGDSIFKVLDIPQEFKKAKNIYPKYISVFGIHIFASGKVRDNKIIHAANIMAEYLDNDEDGIPDNQKVVDKMVRKKAVLLMSFSQDEWDKEKDDFFEIYEDKNLMPQSLYDLETNPGGGKFDAALEEVLHLITEKGYGFVYPKELGKSSSLLAKAMDKARGGKFKKVPKEYPEEAWYSYYDKGCTYRCMKAEYIYWALTSYLGAQKNRENMIGHEWKPNTKEKLIQTDPDVVKIITDPKFKFPTKLPDGNYKPS